MKKVNVKYITRTIKSAHIRAKMYNVEDEAVFETEVDKVFHGETVEELKGLMNVPGMVCLKICDCEITEQLYKIPEDVFLAYATPVEK